MSAKHTPGPWSDDVEEGIPGVFAEDGVAVAYTGEVAGIVRHFQRDNCEADARLIAAAPELLSMLVMLRKHDAASSLLFSRRDEIDALISKATGRPA